MRIIYLTISGLFMSGIVLAGCRRSSSDIPLSSSLMESDSIPVKVKTLAKAMAENDSDGFSSMVSYPLARPYPLKDVANKEEMKKYYSVMVDDSLRRKVATSTPGAWSEAGWRGWTLEEGNYVWMDDSVYDVTYLSPREKDLMEQLIERERRTLAPELRKGWVPKWVMQDPSDGTIYRIDANSPENSQFWQQWEDSTTVYRLAVYDKGKNLRDLPKRMLKGRRRMEGTMGETSFYFDSLRPDNPDENSEIVIFPYSSESGEPKVFNRNDTIDRPLRKIYWLDVVGPDYRPPMHRNIDRRPK